MNTDFLPFKVEAYPETESPYFLPARMTHGQNRPSLASGRDALRRGKIGQATGALASPTGERSPFSPSSSRARRGSPVSKRIAARVGRRSFPALRVWRKAGSR